MNREILEKVAETSWEWIEDNRPQPGDIIKVEPIRDLKAIEAIRHLLRKSTRNLCLFTVGINTNLRASDLLRLRVGPVEHSIDTGLPLKLREKKTGKIRKITLNTPIYKSVKNLLATDTFYYEDFLFRSQRGKVLTVPSVHRLVKDWCKKIGLEGNYGSHTLRKTWGYHMYHTFKIDLPRLVICFNHSSQKQTLDYLCIDQKEIDEVYLNEL